MTMTPPQRFVILSEWLTMTFCEYHRGAILLALKAKTNTDLDLVYCV